MKDLNKGPGAESRGRNLSYGIITALVIAIFIVANTLIYVGYNAFLTSAKTVEPVDTSITDSADMLFKSAASQGKKLIVTFCMSESDIENDTYGGIVYKVAKEFAEKYPDFITLRYANIFTLKYEDNGDPFDVSKYQKVVRKDIEGNVIVGTDGKPVYDEFSIGRSSVLFECDSVGSDGEVIRNNIRVAKSSDFYTFDGSGYMNSFKGEEMFFAMSGWVIADEHKTAYFTMGHGEVPSTNLYNALVGAGFYVDDINLRKEKVPDDAALVIISNPKSDFDKAAESSTVISELDRLGDYRDRGGAFYLVLDPLAKKLPNLEAFASDFGIGFKTDGDGNRLTVKDLDRAIGTDGFTLVTSYSDASVASNVYKKISELGGNVIIRDAAALDCDESKGAKPLLTSSPAATLEADGETKDTSGSYAVVAYSERYNESGSPAKMVFVPSVYLTADDAMVTIGYSNKNFIYSLFDVFYGAKNTPIGTNSVVLASTMLENLTLGASILYTAMLLAVPAILAVVGTVIIIRRKNR